MAISKKEMMIRNERILDEAFRIFSSSNIESTSMQEIADAAGVGIASLFRYYPAKKELATAVCTRQWGLRVQEITENRSEDRIKDFPAIERLEFSLDLYIELYKNHKDLIVFNGNFNHFINSLKKDEGDLGEYFDVLGPMQERFHWMYEKAKEDKTFRTDIPEDKLMRVIFHTMMGTCTHYSAGIVWGARDDEIDDYTDELIHVKEMIIEYVTK